MSSITPSRPQPLSRREEALRVVENALEGVEHERKEIAHVYANAPSHSDIEHALGESLTYVRKAIEKLTKARNELMQRELGLE